MRILLLFLFIVMVTPLLSQSLKVMTYNIRYDNKNDGVNQWVNRKEKVADLIRQNNPDLIGVQEALLHQLKDLIQLLPDYTYYGVGREDGKEKGEFSAILVRHSRFGVLLDSTFWLSPTPLVAGSKGWDAALPRIATWTKLYDKETKKELFYINTHFDHIGVQARINSAAAMNAYLTHLYEGKPIPLIMTGDLNVERTTEAYKAITDSKLLLDSKPADNNEPTACGFDVANTKCTGIDYILHSKETTVKRYAVLHDNDGKYYPSDHLAVIAELEFAKE